MDALLIDYMPNLAKWGVIWKQHVLAPDWLGASLKMVGTLISGLSSTARVTKECFVPAVKCMSLLLTRGVQLFGLAHLRVISNSFYSGLNCVKAASVLRYLD
jgi:hypothetical protein